MILNEHERGFLMGAAHGAVWFGIALVFAMFDGPRPWESMLLSTIFFFFLMVVPFITARKRAKK